LLWGSNARDTHPIFFHHVLKGLRRGTRMHAVDPRRTSSAAWADQWLGLEVGSDVALANGMAHAILRHGLENREFIARATSGFEQFRDHVLEHFPLERVARDTGIDAATIERTALEYARADRAMICWTLGITEHHNAVDNVLALINLALLTGHVGKWGSGLNPLRGQNNVQGGGDMGALPHKLTGFQDVEDPALRGKFERAWGAKVPPQAGWHLTDMFHAMERKELTALYVIGENPAHSEADSKHALHLLEGLEHIVVQDLFLTRTAELADVVFPATAGFAESEGTVTNSERRVQRVRARWPRRPACATTSRSSASSRAGSRGPRQSDPRSSSGTSCARSRRCTPA
jgi:formate dehydrogenase major subunit